MPYFFLLYWTPSSSLCTVFDTFSCNIDEIFSINPPNMFVFGVMSIIRTGLPILVEVIHLVSSCYNISISNDLNQMVNFPTRFTDCDSHSPALLDLFLLTLVFFYNGFLSIEKCCCFSFHWLSIIFTTRSPVSSHCFWPFLSWLRWSSWSFKRCSMGGHL